MQTLTNSGYHDCPCRDCFEIAIGCDDDNNPDLCSECEEHGCDATGESECDAPGAYGGDECQACHGVGTVEDFDGNDATCLTCS